MHHLEPTAYFEQWVVNSVSILQGSMFTPALTPGEPRIGNTPIVIVLYRPCCSLSSPKDIGKRPVDNTKSKQHFGNLKEFVLYTPIGTILSDSFQEFNREVIKVRATISQQ